MPKNGKFVLYASRKSGQLRQVMLTEETYTVCSR